MKISTSIIIMALMLISCGDANNSVDCKNVLPSALAKFSDVYPLFTGNTSESCNHCHTASNPNGHYDFSSKPSVYDALSTHFDVVYAQVASGKMPKDGTQWSSSNLQTLSSWYCYGGFYEP